MDDKKLNKLEEKIDSIEKKIDKQGERISNVERALFQAKDAINKDLQKNVLQEPEKPSYAKASEGKQQEKFEREKFESEMGRPEMPIFGKTRDKQEEKFGHVGNQDVGEAEGIDFKKFELNIGKYAFQIIGVAIFLMGMGFFFKFAIEKGWFGPLARVISGFVAATGLVLAGEILKKKQWAFGFIAGGVVLYYLSTYAACNLYSLITPSVAFVIFALITILAFALSLLHNSIVIASFSLIGGFLAPLILTKIDSFISVFANFNPENFLLVISYLFLISFAFIILALIKRWYFLAIGTIGFMLLYFNSQMIFNLSLNYQLLNITILYIAFVFVPYIYALIFSQKNSWLESVIIVFGSNVFALYHSYISQSLNINSTLGFAKIDYAIAPIKWLFIGATAVEVTKYLLFIFGFLYLTKTIVMFAKNRLSNKLLPVLATMTILQFFAVIMLHFKNFNLSMALISYAVLILAISFFIKNYYLRIFTYIFAILGFFVYIKNIFSYTYVVVFSSGPLGEFKSLVFNDLNLATAVLIILFAGSAYFANKYKSQLEGAQKILPDILESGVYFTIFSWLTSPLWVWPYRLVAIAVYSLILFYVGAIRSKSYARIYGYFCFLIAILAFIFEPKIFALFSHLASQDKIKYYYEFNLICLALIFVAIGYIILSRFFSKKLKEHEVVNLVKIYELLLCFFSFFCVGRNLYLITEDAWFNTVVISVYYALATSFFIFIGLLLKKHLIRFFGVCLSVLTLWKLWFFVMGMQETGSRVIAFIVIGLIFMLASFIYQKLSKRIL